jgi:hypothetical protein
MQSTVIKSYQVGLGFQWDEESLRKFSDRMSGLHTTVKNFALSMAGLAVAVEEAVRRTAKSYEDLGYLAERTGVSAANLKAMGYAFSQIGLQAEQFGASMSKLARQLRDDPTAKTWLEGQIGSFKTVEEAARNMAVKYNELLKLPDTQANRNRIAQYRDLMSKYMDPDQILQMGTHLEEMDKRKAEALQRYKRFGLDVDEATGRAKGLMESWRRLWDNLGVAFDKIAVTLMPTLERLFEEFADWLEHGGAEKITGWARDLEKWLRTVSFSRLKQGLTDAIAFAETLWGWFKKIEETIGLIPTLLLAAFGPALLKGALFGLARGIVGALFGTTAGSAAAGAAAGTAYGKAFAAAQAAASGGLPGAPGGGKPGPSTGGSGFLRFLMGALSFGGLGFAAAEISEELGVPNASAQRAEEMDIIKKKAREQMWKDGKSPAGQIGDWISNLFGGDRASRPHGYTASPIPAFASREATTLLESIYFGFQHWWSGSGSFSPFVVLTEEFYNKLSDTLEEVFFGSRRTTEHGEGGVPGSGGAAGGAGPGGRERTGGRYGAAGPGREGGSGTGAELGPGGGDSKSGPGEAGEVREKQMKEAQHRRLAITSELRAQLAFAGAQTGILAEVFSGGQHPGQGTGSHRHDLGGSADVRLYDAKTGKILDMRNPEDQKRMAEYTKQAVRAGVTGVGGAPGLPGQAGHYMGPTAMHFGGGTPTTWGAGETSATTPAWIREAWEDARKNRASREEVLKALPKATAGAGGTAGGSAGSGTTSSLQFPADWKPDPSMLNMPESRQDISHPERNNPGNLRVSATNDWVGKRTPAGAAFEFFQTLDQGIRARALTYASYIKRGVNTIRNIAETSGPASDDNDVPAMIKAYQKVLGGKYGAAGGADLPVDLTPENIRRLTAAGISIEVGGHGNFLPKNIPQSRIDKVLQGIKEGRDFGDGGQVEQMDRSIQDRNNTRMAGGGNIPFGTYQRVEQHYYYNGDNGMATAESTADANRRQLANVARGRRSAVV